MSVAASDWTAVGGRLNTALWPGVSASKLAARFTAWIVDAALQPGVIAITDADEQDAASRLWVDYRAWKDVYQLRLANPASVSADGEGSSGYTQGQIDAARDERDTALAAYQEAVGAVTDIGLVPETRFSTSRRASFEF